MRDRELPVSGRSLRMQEKRDAIAPRVDAERLGEAVAERPIDPRELARKPYGGLRPDSPMLRGVRSRDGVAVGIDRLKRRIDEALVDRLLVVDPPPRARVQILEERTLQRVVLIVVEGAKPPMLMKPPETPPSSSSESSPSGCFVTSPGSFGVSLGFCSGSLAADSVDALGFSAMGILLQVD
jgi:hypothetical protein